MSTSVNEHVATKLGEVADLLEQQAANPFRVRAYRRAAETVAGLDRDLQAIVQHGGPEALVELPNIGAGIASAIDEILRTGRWVQLERLRESRAVLPRGGAAARGRAVRMLTKLSFRGNAANGPRAVISDAAIGATRD